MSLYLNYLKKKYPYRLGLWRVIIALLNFLEAEGVRVITPVKTVIRKMTKYDFFDSNQWIKLYLA